MGRTRTGHGTTTRSVPPTSGSARTQHRGPTASEARREGKQHRERHRPGPAWDGGHTGHGPAWDRNRDTDASQSLRCLLNRGGPSTRLNQDSVPASKWWTRDTGTHKRDRAGRPARLLPRGARTSSPSNQTPGKHTMANHLKGNQVTAGPRPQQGGAVGLGAEHGTQIWGEGQGEHKVCHLGRGARDPHEGPGRSSLQGSCTPRPGAAGSPQYFG